VDRRVVQNSLGAAHPSQQGNRVLTFLLGIWLLSCVTGKFDLDIPKIEKYDEGEAKHTQRLELDGLEVQVNATLQSARYLQGLRRHYNKSVQPHTFQDGDLVLRRIQKTDGKHKLLSPWEGPLIVSKVTRPGSFELMTEDGVPIKNT
jgi:hypothetical protein